MIFDLNSIRQVFNTLPDLDAVEVFLKKLSAAYAEQLGVEVFEFVWKVEIPNGGLHWRILGQHLDPRAAPVDFNANWKKGLFYLAYSTGSPVMAGNLRALASGDIEYTIEEFTKRHITRDDYFIGHASTETEVVVPMKVKENVVGLINVESYRGDVLDGASINELNDIAEPLARIIDAAEYDSQRRKEILEFVDTLHFDPKPRTRNCFLARPFRAEFVPVEDGLRRAASDAGVNLSIVVPDPEKMSIFHDIRDQLTASAFCVVDISGLNPNVLIELGMAVGGRKPFILIQDIDEKGKELPFDVRNIPVYHYRKTQDHTGRTSVDLPDDLISAFGGFSDRYAAK